MQNFNLRSSIKAFLLIFHLPESLSFTVKGYYRFDRVSALKPKKSILKPRYNLSSSNPKNKTKSLQILKNVHKFYNFPEINSQT